MRTIKFRVFANGKMRYPNTNEIIFSNALFYKVNMSDESIDIENVAKMELMQFTGLHDINGKEIYEGDFLSNKNSVPDNVVFKDGCFCFYSNQTGVSRLAQDRCERLEIIGNVFENPELLKAVSSKNKA